VTYGASTTFIRGITIRNANTNDGGGAISSRNEITVRDCVFESNFAQDEGGAIALYEAWGQFVVRNCAFVSNETSFRGGALFVTGAGYLDVMIDSCTFYGNQAAAGGAIHFPYHELQAYIYDCLFVENSATNHGGGIVVESINNAWVRNCTFFANHAPTGSAISTLTWELGSSRTAVRNCILAYGTGGTAYHQSDWSPNDTSIRCTNIYGNEGGDWVGGLLGSRRDVDGNFRACPAFCDIVMAPYDLSLCDQSPCLPGNHPAGYGCGLIGDLGEGCICEPSRTEPTSWGGIKSLYR
jgi:predicted outer membrane repeat protein